MLKAAIIGFGEVACNGHWPAYASSSDVTVAAVVDRSAERRDLAARLCPGVATFRSLADVPASSAIDFVDICTPPALHPEPMLEALARGWHVVCEKPFVLDMTVLDTVRDRASAAGLAVIPVHNWKYAPIVRAATAALQDGAIGALRSVEIVTSRLRAAPTAEADRPNWRRDPEIAGGGILMDHGWHAVYLALHWFKEPVREVRASLHRPPNGGVEDEVRLSLTFDSGDAVIDLTWNGDVRRNAMRLAGDRGQIAIDDDTLHIQGSETRSVRFPAALSAGSHHDDWFAAMLPDLVRCLENPASSGPLLDEAAGCLSVIQQAYRSDLASAGSRR